MELNFAKVWQDVYSNHQRILCSFQSNIPSLTSVLQWSCCSMCIVYVYYCKAKVTLPSLVERYTREYGKLLQCNVACISTAEVMY